MTKFTKTNLTKSGDYLNYRPEGGNICDEKFVARFKYGRSGMASFATFLRKNFTVEEYFARLDADESPLAIVESKGYMLPHIKKWLRDGGYPVTKVGFNLFIQNQMQVRQAQS